MPVDYRKKCLEAKGQVCEICGSSEEIVVHHVNGNRTDNRLENLVPLCSGCHTDVHNGKEHVREWTEKLTDVDAPGNVTTIEITVETYMRLNGRKMPGDSFDDVIRTVLDDLEEAEEMLDDL